MGFTDSCAALWAHWGTSNEALCSSICYTEAQELFEMNNVGADEIQVIPSNGPPPFCSRSQCQSCSADMFEEDFDVLAGIWQSPRNAGMLDSIAHDCQSFYAIENHDPCQGTAATAAEPTTVPTLSRGVFSWAEIDETPPLVLTVDSIREPSSRPSSRLMSIGSFSPAEVPTPLVLTVDLASEPSPMPSISRLSVGPPFRTVDMTSISEAGLDQQQSSILAPIPTPLVLTIDFPIESSDEVHQQQGSTPAPIPPLVLSIDFPFQSPDEVHQQQITTPGPTPPLVLTIDFPTQSLVEVHQQQRHTPVPTPLVISMDFPLVATSAAAPTHASSRRVAQTPESSALQIREFSPATFHSLLVIGGIISIVILLA
jgi:hypothetical protein